MIFREVLYNEATQETRPGNILENRLDGDIEQITIDSSVYNVKYYYVHTPNNVWKKTQFYELVDNLYTVTYMINDTVYDVYYLLENETVTVPTYTAETGYEWSGWLNNVPSVMPAANLVINSKLTHVSYNLVYFIDNRLVHFEPHYYGDELTEYVPEAKDGYVFSGWTGFPEPEEEGSYSNMPAQDVIVTGSYTANNSYTLTYMIDSSVYSTVQYKAGELINSAAEQPEIETGYSWTGWINEPATMPAQDYTVNSSLVPNDYALDYYVDSSLWKSVTYPYKSSVTPQYYTPPTGMQFSGFLNEPATMPAIDHYRVAGTTSDRVYKISYYSDPGNLYAEQILAEGSEIPQIECAKYGYVFSGWSPEIPKYMPNYNINTIAQYISGQYELRFTTANIYGRLTVLSYTMNYNDIIDTSLYPKYDDTSIYQYVADDVIPERMPAHDLNIYGRFVMNSNPGFVPENYGIVTWYLDSSLYQRGVYMYDSSVVSPVCIDSSYIYDWNGKDTFLMPHYDTSVNGTKVRCANTVTWYLDSSLIEESVHEWDSIVTSPLCDESGYLFNWNGKDTFPMPHYDTSVNGTKVKCGIVTWYIDNEILETRECAYGYTIKSPVSNNPEYVYNWNGNDTFVMPEQETVSIYGTTVSTGVVEWYVDSSLIHSGVYGFASVVTSPVSDSSDCVYNWSGNDRFVMPQHDVSVFGTKVETGGLFGVALEHKDSGVNHSFMMCTYKTEVDWVNLTGPAKWRLDPDLTDDPSQIGYVDEVTSPDDYGYYKYYPYTYGFQNNLPGFGANLYSVVHHPAGGTYLNCLGRLGGVLTLQYSYDGTLWYNIHDENNSTLDVSVLNEPMGYQDHELCGYEILFNTSNIPNGDIQNPKNCVVYLRLHFVSFSNPNNISDETIQSALFVAFHDTNAEYGSTGVGYYNSAIYSRNSRCQLIGEFDTFYEHAVQQFKEHFNIDKPVRGIRLSTLWNIDNAYNVIERSSYNYIISGFKQVLTDAFFSNQDWIAYDFVIPDTGFLKTPPQILTTDTNAYAYHKRWAGDKELIYGQNLPAETVHIHAYESMYEGCTSLVKPGMISGNFFDYGSCKSMYKGCTSLESRVLLDTSINAREDTFDSMYEGCTSLPLEE